MFGLKVFVPVMAITTWLVVPVKATTSYYSGASGETSFNAAVGGLTLLNPALTFSGDLESNGLLNASGTAIDFLGFDDFQYPTIAESFTITGSKLTATNQGEHVTINFPAAGVYAFGFHFTVTSGTTNICVELTHGTCDYNFPNVTSSSSQFFGIVSTVPITAPLDVRDQGTFLTTMLTGFEAFGSTPVPEPRTWLLVGLGLITLLLLRRSQKAG
jgi:hypothetical protein